MFNFAESTIDMTAAEILNYYRNLYYAEPQVTERGIVANAINDYFKEVVPRAEVEQVFKELELMFEQYAFEPRYTVLDMKSDVEALKKKYTEGQK